MTLKKKRLESVFTEGFFSDPKELYKPIGEVTLDTKDLLYQSLQLEINQRYGHGRSIVFLPNKDHVANPTRPRHKKKLFSKKHRNLK